jgi:hypothetical protein
MTVLEIITNLVNKRKAERKFPHCAMIIDAIAASGLSKEAFLKETEKLKSEGKIAIKDTINSTSYYLI